MNTGTSALGTIMNSTAMQQQQQTRNVQAEQQVESKPQDVALPEDSTVNELEISVAYEVKLSSQVDASYTQPQPAEAKSSTAVETESAATGATSQAAPQSVESSSTVATESSSSYSSSDLTSMTEQEMQTLVTEGSITRTQMLDEMERRNGGAEESSMATSAMAEG